MPDVSDFLTLLDTPGFLQWLSIPEVVSQAEASEKIRMGKTNEQLLHLLQDKYVGIEQTQTVPRPT